MGAIAVSFPADDGIIRVLPVVEEEMGIVWREIRGPQPLQARARHSEESDESDDEGPRYRNLVAHSQQGGAQPAVYRSWGSRCAFDEEMVDAGSPNSPS